MAPQLSSIEVAHLASTHPVLASLVHSTDSLVNQESLLSFVQYCAAVGDSSASPVPSTLSEFYPFYIKYKVSKHIGSRWPGVGRFIWEIDETLTALSSAAFLHFVRKMPITAALMHRLLPKIKYRYHLTSAKEPSIEHRTFGFLKFEDCAIDLNEGISGGDHKLSSSSNRSSASALRLRFGSRSLHDGEVLRFTERGVEEYFAALYQKSVCFKHLASPTSVRKQPNNEMPSSLRCSMEALPDTGDIWRMTFGLIAMEMDDWRTPYLMQLLMKMLLLKLKTVPAMTSHGITRLCVEAVYESKNVGGLANFFGSFSTNRTLSYAVTAGSIVENTPAHNLGYCSTGRELYAISAIGNFVKVCGDVYGLHLSKSGLDQQSVTLLTQPLHLVSDNNIQVLDLSGNHLGVDGMRCLQRFLIKASLLSHLDLSCCDVAAAGMKILSDVIMCSPLTYLRLSGNNIGNAGLCYLASNLLYVPTLEWLDVSDNDVHDLAAIRLANALKNVSCLRILNLTGNSIGDDGSATLAVSVASHPSIARLLLGGNQIGARGSTSLTNILQSAVALRYIDVRENRIPLTSVLALQTAADASLGLIYVDSAKQSAPQWQRRETMSMRMSRSNMILAARTSSPEDSMVNMPVIDDGGRQVTSRKSTSTVFIEAEGEAEMPSSSSPNKSTSYCIATRSCDVLARADRCMTMETDQVIDNEIIMSTVGREAACEPVVLDLLGCGPATCRPPHLSTPYSFFLKPLFKLRCRGVTLN